MEQKNNWRILTIETVMFQEVRIWENIQILMLITWSFIQRHVRWNDCFYEISRNFEGRDLRICTDGWSKHPTVYIRRLQSHLSLSLLIFFLVGLTTLPPSISVNLLPNIVDPASILYYCWLDANISTKRLSNHVPLFFLRQIFMKLCQKSICTQISRNIDHLTTWSVILSTYDLYHTSRFNHPIMTPWTYIIWYSHPSDV